MIHGYKPEPAPEATEGPAVLGPQPYSSGATLGPDRPDTFKFTLPFMAVAKDGFLSFRHATRLLKAVKACGLEIQRGLCLEGRMCLIGSVWFDECSMIHYT